MPTEDLESRWPGRSCRCQSNKLKMDCRCCKLLLFFFSVSFCWLSVFLEQDCRCILLQFRSNVACRQYPLEGLSSTHQPYPPTPHPPKPNLQASLFYTGKKLQVPHSGKQTGGYCLINRIQNSKNNNFKIHH